MKPPSSLDTDTRELVNHLFSVATAILEDAIEAGFAGQSPNLTAKDCRARARKLMAFTDDVRALAAAALVVTNYSRPQASISSRRHS